MWYDITPYSRDQWAQIWMIKTETEDVWASMTTQDRDWKCLNLNNEVKTEMENIWF